MLLRGRLQRILALPPAHRCRAPSSGDRPLQPAGEPTRQAREDGSDRREGHDPCTDGLQQGGGSGASAVNVPSVEQEDHRRLVRERQSLVYDRTAHTNRIRGLLLTQGIVGFDPRADGAEQQLDQLVTGDGRPLGPRLKGELRREIGRLRVLIDQLKDVSAERNAIAPGKKIDTTQDEQGSADADAKMIAALTCIKGVGPNDAPGLVREAFWRKFNNRRELAAWSGLAPMPGPAEPSAATKESPRRVPRSSGRISCRSPGAGFITNLKASCRSGSTSGRTARPVECDGS